MFKPPQPGAATWRLGANASPPAFSPPCGTPHVMPCSLVCVPRVGIRAGAGLPVCQADPVATAAAGEVAVVTADLQAALRDVRATVNEADLDLLASWRPRGTLRA
jgi:hypothetical protein